jgi:ubiE/COQ5 methyltransferase family
MCATAVCSAVPPCMQVELQCIVDCQRHVSVAYRHTVQCDAAKASTLHLRLSVGVYMLPLAAASCCGFNIANRSSAAVNVFTLCFVQVPNDLLRKVYDTYSFSVIPKVGEVVANDKAAYQVSTGNRLNIVRLNLHA